MGAHLGARLAGGVAFFIVVDLFLEDFSMSAESGMSSSLASSMSRALRSLCIQPEMARLSWSR